MMRIVRPTSLTGPLLQRNVFSLALLACFFAAPMSPAGADQFERSVKAWLDSEKPLTDFPDLDRPLSRREADSMRRVLADHRAAQLREKRREELQAWTTAGQTGASGEAIVEDAEKPMRCFFKTYGKRPESGRSVFISMHGGGNAPPRINDSQWENQKRLYAPEEGIYVAPRAPTDTWNLWHEGHIDRLLTRLIENLLLVADANPDRVYLMGYSAGGDGVYQLAPRIADRFAAASMMAGHPNEASPLGLRNLPFSLQVGGRDAAYKRNKIAEDWKRRFVELQEKDPNGYTHWVKIYPSKGHWMDREDAVAVPWMAEHNRRAFPEQVVWQQDDVTHSRFYWLQCDASSFGAGMTVTATIDDQTVRIKSKSDATIRLHLDDRLIDLDKPVIVNRNGQRVFEGSVSRTIRTLWRDLERRYDPVLATPAMLEIMAP